MGAPANLQGCEIAAILLRGSTLPTSLGPIFQTRIPNVEFIFSYNLLPGGKSFFPTRVAVRGSGQSPTLGHGPEVWSESPWLWCHAG